MINMIRVTNTQILKDKLYEKGNVYECIGEFSGSQTKILFNKIECNHKPFLATPNNILKKYDCPECAMLSRINTKRKNSPVDINVVRNTLTELYPDGKYTLVDGQEYINNKQNMYLLCSDCNKKFSISLVNIRQGRGCSHCRKIFSGKKYSKNSLKIEDYLKENAFKFTTEYTFDDCKFIKKLPFDFAVFINDSIILIEYDGEQHFRPFNKKVKSAVKAFDDLRRNDEIKNNYCKENNYHLIRINYLHKDVIAELEKNLHDLFNDYPLTGSEILQ